MNRIDAGKETRSRILRLARNRIGEGGFTASGIGDICEAAGITKGAFFHQFKSKEEMAREAAKLFADFADQLFTNALYQQVEDPVDRLLAYIDFRESLLQGEIPQYTCLLGTLAQEVF